MTDCKCADCVPVTVETKWESGAPTGDAANFAVVDESRSLTAWATLTPEDQIRISDTVRAHMQRLTNTVDNWLPAAPRFERHGDYVVQVRFPLDSAGTGKSLAERLGSAPVTHEEYQANVEQQRQAAIAELTELVNADRS